MRLIKPIETAEDREKAREMTSADLCSFVALVCFIGFCFVVFFPSDGARQLPLFDRFCALRGVLIGVTFGIARTRLLRRGKIFRSGLIHEIFIAPLVSGVLFLIVVALSRAQWLDSSVFTENSSRYFSSVALFASGFAGALTVLLLNAKEHLKLE